jgi:O-succinylbenzoate synthase
MHPDTPQYSFEFRTYQRQFKQPLQTSHGSWEMREGIILSLKDDEGKVSWGEIAPLPWFGSETLEEAYNFCDRLPKQITEETIFSIPDGLSATQFGFESAWEEGERGREGERESIPHSTLNTQHSTLPTALNTQHFPYSALLPTGEAGLQAWENLWERGYRTFKWKIGVAAIAQELKWFEELMELLPAGAKLRLDANGGLSWEGAREWLKVCDRRQVEFLEQPLAVDRFEAMLELSSLYSTPLALDESVAAIAQLQECYQQGWRGIFVVKPGIAGSIKRLRRFCRQYEVDLVFSSVFETKIGRQAALRLAGELSRGDRALGFGIDCWFEDGDIF